MKFVPQKTLVMVASFSIGVLGEWVGGGVFETGVTFVFSAFTGSGWKEDLAWEWKENKFEINIRI